ncbi:MAG: esterase/lipase family protein [Akkermansiaceae bacterium]
MLIHKLICSLGLTLLLSNCGGLGVKELNKPVAKLTGSSNESVHYAAIYQLIRDANKLEDKSPTEAISKYLHAAYRVDQAREKSLLPLYNHAVGQVIDLLAEQSERGEPIPQSFKWRGLTVNLDAKAKDSYGYGVDNYDDIIPCDMLKYSGWRTDVKTTGVGAPLVARLGKKSLSRKHSTRLPYNSPLSGYSYPLSGLLEFSSGANQLTAKIRLLDPTITEHIHFWGKKRVLSKNLTAPLAVSLHEDSSTQREGVLAFLGVFEPVQFSDKVGIYSLAPLDPKRIPVVLVHGLNSDPATWRDVINELNEDPVVRKKYQFLAFYYPTGLPLRVSSAELKRRINGINKYYRKHGYAGNANQMVIVGHSLGGLLTSAQVRKIDGGISKKIFRSNMTLPELKADALRDLNYLLKGPKPSFLKRVVFIATPHRGSRKADIYLVRLLSSLIKLPEKMLILKVPEAASALTDFGRALLGAENPTNSLTILRSRSAPLKILSESPIYKHIKYHSIMGDRGRGDTPNSSDGVVEYHSSHLDGAQSELIVPAHHSAHEHPNAIKELRRILRLHLKSN